MDKKHEGEKLSEIEVEKRGRKVRTGVYDGTIENGMTKIIRFGSNKKKLPEILFSTLAKSTFNQKFYFETLKLKSENINLFFQFCDADPKSKLLIEDHNTLIMMDFLLDKNNEFQKLQKIDR